MTGDGLAFHNAVPPDDGGRDAFERFRYQAHVAFQDCLRCAAGEGVDAVICEHFEDLCVEASEVVALRQIKTRNLDYGLWRLADLCAERGAFRSLLRSHRSLKEVNDDREFLYEAVLEGALKRDDPICQFPPRGDVVDDTLAKWVIKEMKPHTELRLAEAREFLARVRILPAAQRDSIVALNRELLASAAGYLPAAELAKIYDDVIEVICQAMSGTRLPNWPEILFMRVGGDESKNAVERKRLDQSSLREPLERVLSGNGATLREITDSDLLTASALERKLRLAGAPEGLIERAKQLRANATYREIELRSQSLGQDLNGKLEDLRERLKLAIDLSLGVSGKGVDPAPLVFADLTQRLGEQPATYDPNGLFRQDPALLVGGVCDLSDRCIRGWRGSE
jgi:hypothetical protein